MIAAMKRLAKRLADTVKERDELRHQLGLANHYISTYGNARGRCEYGYPQHPNYICGLCRHDRSVDRSCPKVTT